MPKLRTTKSLIIAEMITMIAIVINAVMPVQVPRGYVMQSTGKEFLIAFSILILGLLLGGLIMPDKPSVAATSNKEANIELLKKLKTDGEITEEEYKTRLMKELDS